MNPTKTQRMTASRSRIAFPPHNGGSGGGDSAMNGAPKSRLLSNIKVSKNQK